MYTDTDKQRQRLVDDIRHKASNNVDGEIWIHPSEYGFKRTDEGIVECEKYLMKLDIIKDVSVKGKDLLYIKTYK